MKRLSSLWTFFRIPWADKFTFIEAVLTSGWSHWMLKRPFPVLSRLLGTHQEESARIRIMPEHLRSVLRIKQALYQVNRWIPWNTRCINQALTAKTMLSRRGIDGTVHLGVRRAPDGHIDAHAWLRTGTQTITGAYQCWTYSIVSTFAFGPIRKNRPRTIWKPEGRSQKADADTFTRPSKEQLTFRETDVS